MVKRRLWHDSDDGRVEILQDELIPFNKPLIILGEAGMGKSHLLDWLKAFPGYAYCTARQPD